MCDLLPPCRCTMYTLQYCAHAHITPSRSSRLTPDRSLIPGPIDHEITYVQQRYACIWCARMGMGTKREHKKHRITVALTQLRTCMAWRVHANVRTLLRSLRQKLLETFAGHIYRSVLAPWIKYCCRCCQTVSLSTPFSSFFDERELPQSIANFVSNTVWI